jgi:hypothetical protein
MTALYQETPVHNQGPHADQWLVTNLLMLLNELELAAFESDIEDTAAPHREKKSHAGRSR